MQSFDRGKFFGGVCFWAVDLFSLRWRNCSIRWVGQVTADLSDGYLAEIDSDVNLFASNAAELGVDDSVRVICNSAAFDSWLAEFDGYSAALPSNAAEFASGAAGFDANSAERIGQSQATAILPAIKKPRASEAFWCFRSTGVTGRFLFLPYIFGDYILDSLTDRNGEFSRLKSSRQVRSHLERTKEPETRQNTRGLILHTARSAPKERQMPEPPPTDHIVGQLDVGIRKAVEVFQKYDIETFESCEGGTGHAYPEPTVAFYGGPGAGWSAVSVCLTHGLPVQSLRRVWDVLDTNDVTGPHWEITFRERLH